MQDWTHIASGVISLGSLAVALLALWHTRKIDRRVHLQPYFARKWRFLHEPLVEYLAALSKWHSRAIDLLTNVSIEQLPDLPITSDPPYATLSWAYDQKTKRLLDEIHDHVDCLRGLAIEFNKLRHITSDRHGVVFDMLNAGVAAPAGYYEAFGGEQALRTYVRGVCMKCLGKPEALRSELAGNPTYQRMIADSRDRIRSELVFFGQKIRCLDRKIDEYGTRFLGGVET